ncbi:MAG: UMP kinase [Candidatus Nealsonbacteria bacterium]|nr:UMP kinase [Candidatus Nealsonbacteria bacterium]
MASSKIFIISLGGSIVAPKSGEVNISFLKKFKKLVLGFVNKGHSFVIVVGGGKLARVYQEEISNILKPSFEDKDWLGILTTRLNAQFVKIIFGDKAHSFIVTNPTLPIKTVKPIIISAGWKPGWSTDYIAVLLAKKFGAKEIINASNIPFVYSEDPKLAKVNGRKPKAIPKLFWKEYRKLIGGKWIPGLGVPIDPIAAKEAQKQGIKAIIVLGTDLKNLKNLLSGKNFRGTTIA